MLESINQRRHLVRRHAGLLAGDAQALDGIRVGNLPSQRMNTRGVDEGTRAVFLQVDGVRELLVGVVTESLPPCLLYTSSMKTDLTREQMMMIVERARQQRSIAAGDVIAAGTRKALVTLARWADRFLHILLMSPTARQ